MEHLWWTYLFGVFLVIGILGVVYLCGGFHNGMIVFSFRSGPWIIVYDEKDETFNVYRRLICGVYLFRFYSITMENAVSALEKKIAEKALKKTVYTFEDITAHIELRELTKEA